MTCESHPEGDHWSPRGRRRTDRRTGGLASSTIGRDAWSLPTVREKRQTSPRSFDARLLQERVSRQDLIATPHRSHTAQWNRSRRGQRPVHDEVAERFDSVPGRWMLAYPYPRGGAALGRPAKRRERPSRPPGTLPETC